MSDFERLVLECLTAIMDAQSIILAREDNDEDLAAANLLQQMTAANRKILRQAAITNLRTTAKDDGPDMHRV